MQPYNYFELETTPINEECVQVKSGEDYMPAMREQAQRFKALLMKRFINLPAGMDFIIKRFEHDFGGYLEVCIRYFDDENESVAVFIQDNLPEKWSDEKVFDISKEVMKFE